MTGQELLTRYKNGEREFPGINLEGANLSKVDLRDANLSGAILSGAILRDANLRDANLWKADLWKADLWDADLGYANLRNAVLEGARLDYQIQEGLLEQIAQKVFADPSSLEMGHWHLCETVHCLAGWACYFNPVAKGLETTHGTAIAALLVLGAEAHSHFWDKNEEALDWLKTKI